MNDQMKEIMRLRDSAKFLGYEFLTWCFLLLDRDDASDAVEAITKDVLFKSELRIVLGQSMVTCLLHHKEQKTSLKTPILEQSHEAFASLRNGHVIESLALDLKINDASLGINIHAHDFGLSQAKIKNDFDNESLTDGEENLDEQDKNREEVFLRMALLDDAERVLNALYAHFLLLRLDDTNYTREKLNMRRQIDKRLGSYLNDSGSAAEQSMPAAIAV